MTLTNVVGTTTNVTDYTYDKLNRLLTAVTGATTVNYAYDLNGSRTNKTVVAVSTGYTYDTLNRLVSASTNGVTVFTAQYDYRTRRLTKDEGTATYFRYDSGDFSNKLAVSQSRPTRNNQLPEVPFNDSDLSGW